jgi:hypothetical protein
MVHTGGATIPRLTKRTPSRRCQCRNFSDVRIGERARNHGTEVNFKRAGVQPPLKLRIIEKLWSRLTAAVGTRFSAVSADGPSRVTGSDQGVESFGCVRKPAGRWYLRTVASGPFPSRSQHGQAASAPSQHRACAKSEWSRSPSGSFRQQGGTSMPCDLTGHPRRRSWTRRQTRRNRSCEIAPRGASYRQPGAANPALSRYREQGFESSHDRMQFRTSGTRIPLQCPVAAGMHGRRSCR